MPAHDDSDEGLLTPGEWMVLDIFREEYEAAVARFLREGTAAAWEAVDTALVQLEGVYAWGGALMWERRERGEHPGLELSATLERSLAVERRGEG